MIAHGIDLNSEAILDFCRKWKIRELCVFGSILRDDFRPDSDIDFLVDFEAGAAWDLFDRFDMEEELAGIVGAGKGSLPTGRDASPEVRRASCRGGRRVRAVLLESRELSGAR